MSWTITCYWSSGRGSSSAACLGRHTLWRQPCRTCSVAVTVPWTLSAQQWGWDQARLGWGNLVSGLPPGPGPAAALQLRADSQHQPASSTSGMAGWIKKREWNLEDRAGQGHTAWGVFYKPAWTDSGAVSKGFSHCKEIEMIEWILMGNIEKQCIQAQFQGMAGKWMPQASSFLY